MSRTIAPTAGRYRTKPVEVDAIRFLGTANCEEVYTFLGLEHPSTEDDHKQLEDIGDTNRGPEVGDWIVRDADGTFEVFDDEEFWDEFEAAGDE